MQKIFSVLLLAFMVISTARMSYPVSYSTPGVWEVSSNPERDCIERFMCTGTNRTWIPQNGIQFDHQSACKALIDKGITRILFHGDSFMRQIYAAMLITLNGNYMNGSISTHQSGSQCTYHKQFYEKKCGVRQLNHHGLVCDGKLLLDPILKGVESLSMCSKQNGSVVLFSFGNYKLDGGGRHGVNDAGVYSNFFKRTICPHVLGRSPNSTVDLAVEKVCSIWWVSTHARLRAYNPDEAPPIIEGYNSKMRAFYDARSCGPVSTIDVFNMTAALIESSGYRSNEVQAMSYDQVHWGMEVNLIKAQIIINALTQAPFR